MISCSLLVLFLALFIPSSFVIFILFPSSARVNPTCQNGRYTECCGRSSPQPVSEYTIAQKGPGRLCVTSLFYEGRQSSTGCSCTEEPPIALFSFCPILLFSHSLILQFLFIFFLSFIKSLFFFIFFFLQFFPCHRLRQPSTVPLSLTTW